MTTSPQRGTNAPPALCGSLDALPDYAFRRVLLKGRFLPTYLLLGPRVYEGFPGAHLVQPFARTPADPTARPTTLLVNRGFVTSTRADAIRSGAQEPPDGPNPVDGGGEVVIEGILKREEGQGRFQPTNDPQANMWFWSDVEGMAQAVGGEEKGVQAVLVDQIYGGPAGTGLTESSRSDPCTLTWADNSAPATMHLQQGVPVGRPPVIELRNMHATYAATWCVDYPHFSCTAPPRSFPSAHRLSLSAATTVMLVRLIRKGRTAGAGATNPRLRGR